MSENINIEIIIIGAMDEEVGALLHLMTDVQEFKHTNFVYFKGTLNKKEVVVLKSGLGKVNAALATSFVIETFNPKFVINIGSAGGFDKALSVGDVVVSSAVVYHDVDVTLLGFTYGQVPNLPVQFLADEKLIDTAEKAVSTATGLKLTKGVVASGDVFVSQDWQIDIIRQRFSDVTAVDMEAAAIAHTCYLYGVPFVVIRAISDMVGNKDNHVDFFSFLKQASVHSANTVQYMVGLM